MTNTLTRDLVDNLDTFDDLLHDMCGFCYPEGSGIVIALCGWPGTEDDIRDTDEPPTCEDCQAILFCPKCLRLKKK